MKNQVDKAATASRLSEQAMKMENVNAALRILHLYPEAEAVENATKILERASEACGRVKRKESVSDADLARLLGAAMLEVLGVTQSEYRTYKHVEWDGDVLPPSSSEDAAREFLIDHMQYVRGPHVPESRQYKVTLLVGPEAREETIYDQDTNDLMKRALEFLAGKD